MAMVLKQELQDRFSARNEMMAEMRKRRYQDVAPSVPAAYRATAREMRMSLFADTIDLMSAIVDDAPWQPHCDPYDVTETARRNSSLREAWSLAAILQAEKDLGRAVITNTTNNQMGDGVGVLKVVYRPDSWKSLPRAKPLFGKSAQELSAEEAGQYEKAIEQAKKGAPLPFSIVDVDPITWHPGYGPDGTLQFVIEVREQPLHEALYTYRDTVGLRGEKIVSIEALGESVPYWDYGSTQGDPRSRVEVWEYHDLEDSITFVEDVPVHYSRHGMGTTPYFECYAKPSPDRDPARNSRPVLYKQRWMMDFLDSLWTMASNAAYLYSYPTPVVETPPGADVSLGEDGRPDIPTWEVGKMMRLYPGQKFSFAAPPLEHMRLMMDLMNTGVHQFEASTGLGPAIRGIGGSDQPGYAINQLMQASMMSLHPAVRSRDWMLARVIAYIWRLIERRIKDDVWVWGTDPDPDESGKKWIKLGPRDIGGYYKVEVETKPLVDQMKISKGQFAAGMVKAKLLDRRRAIEEYLGYPDPEGVMDDIMVDEVTSGGPLFDAMMERVLKRKNLLPGGGGAPPPAGPPPEMPFPMAGNPPGLPPQPGQGMPLSPPPPPNPGMTEGQMQQMGSAMPGGRAAGGDRMPPTQPSDLIGSS